MLLSKNFAYLVKTCFLPFLTVNTILIWFIFCLFSGTNEIKNLRNENKKCTLLLTCLTHTPEAGWDLHFRARQNQIKAADPILVFRLKYRPK